MDSSSNIVPKVFLIRCPKCRWGRTSSGVKSDLVDLVEIQKSCVNCHGKRKFKCPKCGQPAIMTRIKSNSSTSTDIKEL